MKNAKIYLLFTTSIFIILLISAQISAGWWSNLFKTASEDRMIVKAEKKNLLIESKAEQKLSNYERGMLWESTVERQICSVTNCIKDADYVYSKLRWSYGYSEQTVILVGGKETNKFINEEKLYNSWSKFTKEPDFLEIKYANGEITGITVLDAKTSTSAVRSAQDSTFKDLCRYSTVPYKIEYVVPKASLSQSDINFLCLTGAALTFTGPVGIAIDTLCFIATS